MLGDGYYSVWIAALGKPGGSTNGDVSISGMVNLGTLQVERTKGTPNWNEETSIFFMTYAQVYEYFFNYYGDTLLAEAAALEAWSILSNSGLVWDPVDYGFLSEPSVWVFDFFDYLAEQSGITDVQYYWDMDNKGLRHIQLRFYQIKNRNFEWDLPEPAI